MRLTLALCLALAACGSDPTSTPDASQPSDVAPDVVTADTSMPDVAAVVDAVDVAVEASAADAGNDTVAVVDASPVDVAPDARSCGSAITVECQINGHFECVNITTGRVQADGTTLHCGACGVTCSMGYACLARVCERL